MVSNKQEFKLGSNVKLTFLGTGSAFTTGCNNFQSNMLLENTKGKRLLIDCGSDVRLSLFEQGFSYEDISAVFISHLHADHTGGLEWLAFNTYFHKLPKPALYISNKLVKCLWNNVLKGGLDSLDNSKAALSTFFDVRPVADPGYFIWSRTQFTLIPTRHTKTFQKNNPSFGLMFKVKGKTLLITADTQFTPKLFEDYYDQADMIFHDCEVSDTPSGVHATYEQLKELDPVIKGKMWLYHYDSNRLPNAKKDGFLGFVKKGQTFNFK